MPELYRLPLIQKDTCVEINMTMMKVIFIFLSFKDDSHGATEHEIIGKFVNSTCPEDEIMRCLSRLEEAEIISSAIKEHEVGRWKRVYTLRDGLKAEIVLWHEDK